MSLAVDPDFADNRRIYTCQGWRTTGGGHDVRVIAWTARRGRAPRPRRIKHAGHRAARPPAGGTAAAGCSIAGDGALLVGTGDAAVGTNPRNLDSLGGKVLRLDRVTGAPWPTTRSPTRPTRRKRYVLTYGHRNVQGLAQRADGTLWSVEHGTYRDDEVNRLVRRRRLRLEPGARLRRVASR